jgi:HAD superfamily phosphatase (TIGR01668 family)
MSQTKTGGRAALPTSGFWHYLRPDYFADSIYDIDADWLRAKGLEGLIIDVDNTIMARDATIPGPELRAWVNSLRKAGILLLAVSNNWSNRVKNIAEELALDLIAPAAKPLGPAFVRALDQLDLQAQQTAIVGDQLFTDVLGGNRAGLVSIIVAPLGEVDLIHTKVLRVFERIFFRWLSRRILRKGRWQEV